MTLLRFKHVCLESFAVELPPNEVTSEGIEDRLSATYDRLAIPKGSLERVSGVQTRFHWDKNYRPSDGATAAAREALAGVGFDLSEVRSVLHCSISRDYFEPATAVFVHDRLGLDPNGIVLDISNACLGFSTGMNMLANLIESGAVKAGLVVSCETTDHVTNATLEKLSADESTRKEFLELMPTFTLGSGAVAYVLCHESIATRGHRIVGSSTWSETSHSELCIGNEDFCFFSADLNPIMRSDPTAMLRQVVPMTTRAWQECMGAVGWSAEDLDHIVTHQIGRMVDDAMLRGAGLDGSKNFSIFQKYGNQVSAGLPTALAIASKERNFKRGDKILMIGFGSGMVATTTILEW